MLFSTVPYIVAMTKKASAGAAMKRALEQMGCKFIPTNALWYMGSISGKKCDFYIIYDKKVIAVKVVSFIFANTFLRFIDSTTYAYAEIRNKSKVDASSVELKKHKKKAYDFKSSLPKSAEGLPMARVILITDPTPAQVTRETSDGTRVLHPGDKTPEGDYHTKDSFIYLFK